jgi:long-chain acyl-CoA synthetase
MSANLDTSCIEPSRIAFSVPIVNSHIHTSVAGPIFASHPFDLQTFPSENDTFGRLAFVGPPGINLEVKLIGVDDEAVESGKDPVGLLLVRGPPVGNALGVGDEADADGPRWVGTGERARVYTNGSFKVQPTVK